MPMAVLVTTLMTFGKLSENNEITAFKASGITYNSLLKPCLAFAILILTILIPYNLWLLPDMNHDVRKLSFKISKNRPDIEFNENIERVEKLNKEKEKQSLELANNDMMKIKKALKNHNTI